MGETAPVTIVLVHGAGSTGAAAAELLGLGSGTVLLEDRSGDVDQVVAALDATMGRHPDCGALVGVSLGAHAVARWASTAAGDVPRITCVLPAWTGEPSEAAGATALAGREVETEGTAAILARLSRESPHSDVVRLLGLAWPHYSDAQLARALARAGRGRGPTREELAAITVPVTVVGWRGDPFHPDCVTRQWASHLRRPTVAVAARPETRLLRQALSAAPGWA